MIARDIRAYDQQTRSRLMRLAELAEDDGLPFDHPARQTVEEVLDLIQALLELDVPTDHRIREQRTRVLAQLAAACRLAFDVRAPGYAQAGVLAVGNVESLVEDLELLLKEPVNYARWQQPGVEHVERALAEMIGARPGQDTLLATSSGLAALSVVLGMLREMGRLKRVLIIPGTYFETRPTLKLFAVGEIRQAASRDAQAIAAEATSWGADVVFADPLEHGPEQRVVDVQALADELQRSTTDAVMVVDGTMVPSSRVLPSLSERPAPLVIYYESCAKYRQMGLDLTLGGAVVVPEGHGGLASDVRQSLGATLDRFSCEVTPLPEPAEATARLDTMERASAIIAGHAGERFPSQWRVVHPGMPSHPQFQLARRRGYLGACVTFVPEDRSAETVLRFAKRAIELARQKDLDLVVGESLGFTACRLTPTVAAPDVRPFARLATGVVTDDEAANMAEVLARAAADA